MGNESLVGPDAKKMIGAETPLGGPLEIEKGAVLKYLKAIGETSPLLTDEEYARKSRHGKLQVPIAAFVDYSVPSGDEREITWTIPVPATKRVRGKDEIESLHPIYVGDTIRAKTKVIDVYEKQGKEETLVFVVAETQYINQHNSVVMKHRITSIRRK
ncbi:MAG: MaoC family dehydratase N-terminal domain-containing protein [Deltaproteobacteria bacterium]|nr:MaoC family dehydratase N-terminal domain-containing protein [Deltaproteobacteria bacterium]